MKKSNLDPCGEVVLIDNPDYVLLTWGSLLQERFYDKKDGSELTRKLLSLEEAKEKFPNNPVLITYTTEEDLPNYGNDFF